VEPHTRYVLSNENLFTKCGWTPFAGMSVRGKVRKVVLRRETVYEDGAMLGKAGDGWAIVPMKRAP
jgi:dihydroorotase-like cyclic amidohydrolase